jgi:hypothetical protein
MADGELAYDVRIAVSADFDGVLSVPDGVDDPGRRRAFLESLAQTDPGAAMDEVFHEEHHLLCAPCRERFLANPLNLPLPERLPDPPPGAGRGER